MFKRNINNRRAIYITEWDDGRTVLESPCIVDLVSHEIIHIGNRSIVQSEYAPSELDDNIDNNLSSTPSSFNLFTSTLC